MRWLLLIAFGFSGAAALIYEVAWTRALSLVLGSTTYALSTMLSTFMAGLALGSFIGGRLADRSKNLILLFGLMELGIGIFGLVTVPLINALPPIYVGMYKAFHLSPSVYFFFQFLLCAGIMLIPTTLMGATFPVVSRQATSSLDEMGRWVGGAYSFNTIGAIIGSFSAGFLLIPIIGVMKATVVAASLNAVVGIGMVFLSKAKGRAAAAGVFAVVFAGALSTALFTEHRDVTGNFYTAIRFEGRPAGETTLNIGTLIYDKEWREGRVKLYRDKEGFLILQVGGKLEGTSEKDLANTLLLAYLPIASHPAPQSFLNIGLGAGVTLAAAKKHVKDVHLAEINEGVLEAISMHGPRGVLDGVDVALNDARNYLLLAGRKFDIISSEPSYPAESSVGNLFTKEFYELAASRLNPGGKFCQWLPYYILTDDDVAMMLRTFGSVFGHVYMWKTGESLDIIMVGSNEPFMFGPEEIGERVQALNIWNAPLPYALSRTPEQIRRETDRTRGLPLNTDDRPILEFHVAKNFLVFPRDGSPHDGKPEGPPD